MPVFTVRRRVDAYVDYVARISARTAREAARMASEHNGDLEWEEDGVCEFDGQLFIALDADGFEIEETEVRDL